MTDSGGPGAPEAGMRLDAETLMRQVEFILGATRTGLDIIDADYNIRFIDAEWRKVYGEPAGRKCYEYFMGADRVCPGCAVPRALATRKPVVSEEILVREGGRPIQVTTIPFEGPGGEWLVAEVNVDIADRKRAEEALRQARDELEVRVRERTAELARANEDLLRLGRARDEFMAAVSHELRTPLVTGLGYIEMLLEGQLGPIGPEAAAAMRTALGNLRRLSSLIGGILGYNSLVAHESRPALDAVRLGEVLPEEVNGFLTRSGKPPGEVRLCAAADLPPVEANRDLLRGVLANLLDNAGRHAGSGARIALGAERLPDGRVEVSVSDDGAGMPAALREAAFEPFVKSAKGGSGLGLAIVRRSLAAMGASVKLESAPGRGTRVSFALPVAVGSLHRPAEASGNLPAAPEAPGTYGKAEVLAVDDDVDTLEFVRRLLGSREFAVRTASSGREALAALAGQGADLVLIDMSLPDMDGAELCRRIKSGAGPGRLARVVMFSARAESSARRRAREAGCDGYLVKPVAGEELLAAVRAALSGRGGPPDRAGR